jgi:hypothetical protein
MENITVTTNADGIEWVQIDRGNAEYTSMLKSTYDEMINAPTAFPHLP